MTPEESWKAMQAAARKMLQPDKWALVDTGKEYPERFAIMALERLSDSEAIEAVQFMSALNGAPATARVIRKDEQ